MVQEQLEQTQDPLDVWDAIAEAERPRQTVSFGALKIELIAPESKSKIDGLFLPDAKLAEYAKTYSAQLGGKITKDTVSACRLVRICLVDPPDIEKLLRLSLKQPGFLNSLYLAAVDLCGMMNLEKMIADAQGNVPDDQE